MNATLHRSPLNYSPQNPLPRHKGAITVKRSSDKTAQLHSDRMSALFALLAVLILMALLIWLAMTSGSPSMEPLWEYPYLG